jgi:hypothetical protein
MDEEAALLLFRFRLAPPLYERQSPLPCRPARPAACLLQFQNGFLPCPLHLLFLDGVSLSEQDNCGSDYQYCAAGLMLHVINTAKHDSLRAVSISYKLLWGHFLLRKKTGFPWFRYRSIRFANASAPLLSLARESLQG